MNRANKILNAILSLMIVFSLVGIAAIKSNQVEADAATSITMVPYSTYCLSSSDTISFQGGLSLNCGSGYFFNKEKDSACSTYPNKEIGITDGIKVSCELSFAAGNTAPEYLTQTISGTCQNSPYTLASIGGERCDKKFIVTNASGDYSANKITSKISTSGSSDGSGSISSSQTNCSSGYIVSGNTADNNVLSVKCAANEVFNYSRTTGGLYLSFNGSGHTIGSCNNPLVTIANTPQNGFTTLKCGDNKYIEYGNSDNNLSVKWFTYTNGSVAPTYFVSNRDSNCANSTDKTKTTTAYGPSLSIYCGPITYLGTTKDPNCSQYSGKNITVFDDSNISCDSEIVNGVYLRKTADSCSSVVFGNSSYPCNSAVIVTTNVPPLPIPDQPTNINCLTITNTTANSIVVNKVYCNGSLVSSTTLSQESPLVSINDPACGDKQSGSVVSNGVTIFCGPTDNRNGDGVIDNTLTTTPVVGNNTVTGNNTAAYPCGNAHEDPEEHFEAGLIVEMVIEKKDGTRQVISNTQGLAASVSRQDSMPDMSAKFNALTDREFNTTEYLNSGAVPDVDSARRSSKVYHDSTNNKYWYYEYLGRYIYDHREATSQNMYSGNETITYGADNTYPNFHTEVSVDEGDPSITSDDRQITTLVADNPVANIRQDLVGDAYRDALKINAKGQDIYAVNIAQTAVKDLPVKKYNCSNFTPTTAGQSNVFAGIVFSGSGPLDAYGNIYGIGLNCNYSSATGEKTFNVSVTGTPLESTTQSGKWELIGSPVKPQNGTNGKALLVFKEDGDPVKPEISKTIINPPDNIVAGSEINYQIEVKNNTGGSIGIPELVDNPTNLKDFSDCNYKVDLDLGSNDFTNPSSCSIEESGGKIRLLKNQTISAGKKIVVRYKAKVGSVPFSNKACVVNLGQEIVCSQTGGVLIEKKIISAPDNPKVGDNISYQLTLKNMGLTAAKVDKIIDTSSGLNNKTSCKYGVFDLSKDDNSIAASDFNKNCSFNGDEVTGYGADSNLAIGKKIVIRYQATLASLYFTNKACVTSNNIEKCDEINGPSISIEKRLVSPASTASINIGDELTYEVKVTNLTNQDNFEITVEDHLQGLNGPYACTKSMTAPVSGNNNNASCNSDIVAATPPVTAIDPNITRTVVLDSNLDLKASASATYTYKVKAVSKNVKNRACALSPGEDPVCAGDSLNGMRLKKYVFLNTNSANDAQDNNGAEKIYDQNTGSNTKNTLSYKFVIGNDSSTTIGSSAEPVKLLDNDLPKFVDFETTSCSNNKNISGIKSGATCQNLDLVKNGDGSYKLSGGFILPAGSEITVTVFGKFNSLYADNLPAYKNTASLNHPDHGTVEDPAIVIPSLCPPPPPPELKCNNAPGSSTSAGSDLTGYQGSFDAPAVSQMPKCELQWGSANINNANCKLDKNSECKLVTEDVTFVNADGTIWKKQSIVTSVEDYVEYKFSGNDLSGTDTVYIRPINTGSFDAPAITGSAPSTIEPKIIKLKLECYISIVVQKDGTSTGNGTGTNDGCVSACDAITSTPKITTTIQFWPRLVAPWIRIKNGDSYTYNIIGPNTTTNTASTSAVTSGTSGAPSPGLCLVATNNTDPNTVHVLVSNAPSINYSQLYSYALGNSASGSNNSTTAGNGSSSTTTSTSSSCDNAVNGATVLSFSPGAGVATPNLYNNLVRDIKTNKQAAASSNSSTPVTNACPTNPAIPTTSEYLTRAYLLGGDNNCQTIKYYSIKNIATNTAIPNSSGNIGDNIYHNNIDFNNGEVTTPTNTTYNPEQDKVAAAFKIPGAKLEYNSGVTTYLIKGDVRITSDITIANLPNPVKLDKIPSIAIIASGNIYISKDVKKIDANLVAEGRVYLCDSYSSTNVAASQGCNNNQLFIRGLVSAKSGLTMGRTYVLPSDKPLFGLSTEPAVTIDGRALNYLISPPGLDDNSSNRATAASVNNN
jgi:fimbrial isopeptide formation D2 family protein